MSFLTVFLFAVRRLKRILRGIKKIESISYVRLSRTDRLTVDLTTIIVYSQNKLINEMENLLMCEVKIS